MKSFKHQEIIQALQTILNIEQHISGIDYLKEITKNIASTLETQYVLIGHSIKPGNDTVQTDVVWTGEDYYDNFTYELKDTPCEIVFMDSRTCIYPKNVIDRFPKDKLLVEMGVESYIGAPMLTVDAELSGILILLDVNPIEDVDFYSTIVEFLAARAGAELERYYIEEKLKQQVAARTAELEKTNQKLEKALSEIKTLQGIIPICSICKNIRDDQGFWQQVESYISKHSQASFSHAICPECEKEYYADLKNYLKEVKK
ncbi:MAG: GAF domain-containing protein [Thermodesulfobacteriota bacterium]